MFFLMYFCFFITTMPFFVAITNKDFSEGHLLIISDYNVSHVYENCIVAATPLCSHPHTLP